ncbi:MAG: hypothetical protein NXI30_16945 [bacterium]|nr:hypothetical protein [bacterium]
MTRRFASLTALSMVLLACESARMYAGPERESSEIAVIETRDRARLVSVDGKDVGTSTAQVLPGRHVLGFSRNAGRGMFGTPIVSMTCSIAFEAEAGSRYAFRAPLRRRQVSRAGREMGFRWTVYALEPSFIRDDGMELEGLECDSTCRLVGKAQNEERNEPCPDEDKSPYESSLRDPGFGPENDRRTQGVFDQWKRECDRRGGRAGAELAECLTMMSANTIIFRLADGRILAFVPREETKALPGLRRDARGTCAALGTVDTLEQCLSGFGWVRLEE